MRYRLRPPVESGDRSRALQGVLAHIKHLASWSDGRVYQQHSQCFVMTRNGAQRVFVGDYVVRDS
jgi:hypothetical protein